MDAGVADDGNKGGGGGLVSQLPCFFSTVACLSLSVTYVASLYVWQSPHSRNHPSTIKKRFISVFVMMFVSPAFLYLFATRETLRKGTMLEILGLKVQGCFAAVVLPLLLTMILFLGPLVMQVISGIWTLYLEPMHWITSFQNMIWLRNHLVAPLSEEFTFRACMMPLLLQCYTPECSIVICPLFFGVAHFHHTLERVKNGTEWSRALFISCFQFSYTTIFGAYSAYLFYRTGHFLAPFVVHAFCNHMGFPDVSELLAYQEPRRSIVVVAFVIGLLLWYLLLELLTQPELYGNVMA